MKTKSVHTAVGFSQWEDYSEHFETGRKNRANKVIVYTGICEVVALVTKRGRVLASNGMSVNELQYLITRGYIK